MARYKLMQDIEAEDHILGPLSLRQFIYALIAVFCFYIAFLLFSKHVTFLMPAFVLPGLFFGFFAFPFGKDQSTEIWALAKLRFLFKPRRRIWDQDGKKELVTITVPKVEVHELTNGLNQDEVKSRLQALANTIDSRGWATKNVNVNSFSQPDPVAMRDHQSDRLISMSNFPTEVPNYDVQASDDILDETSNPIAQQFQSMIAATEQAHRQQLVNQMNSPMSAGAAASFATPLAGGGSSAYVMPPPANVASYVPAQNTQGQPAPANYWFMNDQPDPAMATAGLTPPAPAQETAEEAALLAAKHKEKSDSEQAWYGNLRMLKPLGSDPQQPVQSPAAMGGSTPAPAMTPQPDPAILNLANNNDLNVATLAREAQKAKHSEDSDEVVISLH